jgi:hypothetical protein
MAFTYIKKVGSFHLLRPESGSAPSCPVPTGSESATLYVLVWPAGIAAQTYMRTNRKCLLGGLQDLVELGVIDNKSASKWVARLPTAGRNRYSYSLSSPQHFSLAVMVRPLFISVA